MLTKYKRKNRYMLDIQRFMKLLSGANGSRTRDLLTASQAL